jgi:hypothetical protein
MSSKKEPAAGIRGLTTEHNKQLTRESLSDNLAQSDYNRQFPTLRGFRVGKQVYLRCPWCDRMHLHGWNEEDSERVVTFRVSHCCRRPGAPFSYRASAYRARDVRLAGYVCRVKGGINDGE